MAMHTRPQVESEPRLLAHPAFRHLCARMPVGAGLYVLDCPCGYRSEPNYREMLPYVCPVRAAEQADEAGR